ncbi:hypothetical protein Q4543_17795 [Salipiger sp. 1_MG-2023]|uniref:hypothetical protein n=1 Tax=Salipiger sp. 1_MG-2023 TaxID=3062665 RepID=UPI0026E47A89|nr:hypothetical protein [Salipiger sp. 1_MG-2023]MDO6587369.1 hypothetical protein [Salipiger sp. 1_MG-2023]
MTDTTKPTQGALREMARDLVRGSIIEDATAQFIALVLRQVHDEQIAPLAAERDALRDQLAEARKAMRTVETGLAFMAVEDDEAGRMAGKLLPTARAFLALAGEPNQ